MKPLLDNYYDKSGETKLIYWSKEPTDPILSKNKKNNITKFWPTGFFNLLFSAF